jgi:ubiquitin carboxyl-terminal hydrolase 14
MNQTLKVNNEEISEIYKGKLEITIKCQENENEEAKIKHENFLKLDCHIDKETTNVEIGLTNSFLENVEQTSETLGRNALYKKTSKITKLPAYLMLNLIRFEWKKVNKAKILKQVKFPMVLDLFEYCGDDLKKDLKVNREIIRMKKDEELKENKNEKNKEKNDEKNDEKNEEKNEEKKDEKNEEKKDEKSLKEFIESNF